MNNRITLILLAGVFTVSGASYAAKAKAKPKPKAKPKAAVTAPHYVKGTIQMAGENAVFGTTYTLGKSNPLNVTIEKAYYSTDILPMDTSFFVPTVDQKFLVIYYTIHNPQKAEVNLDWNTLPFVAVDANDANWEYIQAVSIQSTGKGLHMSLKPAQKTAVFTAILVPAEGEIPKLMLKSSDDTVLRYDIRGKVKGLDAPFADPADKTGATALKKVPAQLGVYYPGYWASIKIDGFSFSSEKIKDNELEEGQRFLVIKFTIKNSTPNQQSVDWNSFAPVLRDTDGNEIAWSQDMLQKSRDVTVSSNMEPGQELQVRYFYVVPKDVDLKTLSIRQSDSRTYAYDLSDVK